MAQSFNTSLKTIAVSYLQLLKAKVTATTIQKDIEENAHYPSLLSLSDTFSKYNIDNSAYEVDKEQFDLLEAPFAAYANMPGIGKDFVLVVGKKDGTVSFLHKSKRVQSISEEDFLARFENVVWFAETNEQSGEADYSSRLKEERKVKAKSAVYYGLCAMLVILAIIMNVNPVNVFDLTSIVLLKIAGLTTVTMLLVYEIDKTNAFVKNLCSAGSHTNCDAVLNSRAAKVMGLSWAEIGFFYFAVTTLYLLFPAVDYLGRTAVMASANVLAIPYILFSIIYQWRVVKQWCPLCLTVQAILFLELIWGIIVFWTSNGAMSSLISHWQAGALPFVFCLLLTWIIWYGIKPMLVKIRDAKFYFPAYRRLQYNPEIFNNLLLQQTQAPAGWKHLGISLGDPNAQHTIIKVCHPFCGPCARAHFKLEDIIRRNSNVQLKVIFTAKNIEGDQAAMVVKHLLAITGTNDAVKTQQILDDWYGLDEKNYALFAAMHPIDTDPDLQAGKLEAMSKWCDDAEVTFTPTIFINGYRLPENYAIDELKNIF
jgi:uncharacterized membrane protein